MDQPIPNVTPIPTHPIPTSKPNWLLLSLMGIGILVVGLVIGLLIDKYIYTLKPIITLPVSTSPTPTTQIDNHMTLGRLIFEIPKYPNLWWTKAGENNSPPPIKWIDINITEPQSILPVFSVRLDIESTNINSKKEYFIKMWDLVGIVKKPITVSTIPGVVISGTINPDKEQYNSRFRKGDRVRIAIFVLGDETYQVLGNVNEYDEEFDQILSTLKFLDTNSNQEYSCPTNGWVDCMPILDAKKQKVCSTDAINWYKSNCPDFQGAAL